MTGPRSTELVHMCVVPGCLWEHREALHVGAYPLDREVLVDLQALARANPAMVKPRTAGEWITYAAAAVSTKLFCDRERAFTDHVTEHLADDGAFLLGETDIALLLTRWKGSESDREFVQWVPEQDSTEPDHVMDLTCWCDLTVDRAGGLYHRPPHGPRHAGQPIPRVGDIATLPLDPGQHWRVTEVTPRSVSVEPHGDDGFITGARLPRMWDMPLFAVWAQYPAHLNPTRLRAELAMSGVPVHTSRKDTDANRNDAAILHTQTALGLMFRGDVARALVPLGKVRPDRLRSVRDAVTAIGTLLDELIDKDQEGNPPS